MQFSGTPSWQVSWGDGNFVRVALYLRDALALPAAPEIPPLVPSVAVTDVVDRTAVAAEWPGWWADVLDFASGNNIGDPRRSLPVLPHSPALVARPALRAALDALGPQAAQHPRPRRTPGAAPSRRIGEFVTAREAELGRKARPFRLAVTELSVDGLLWHRAAVHHVLVSTRFASDEALCAGALREIIAELA
ncbi:hypothetical protein [Kutzneria sp. NPDC052558]|uniref:hypothetical protein n=1 Tax=Kutzneria sp. NPDC052558 TaxID=3364121 RepID=UPI0037C5082B